jgi:hypothetical protein
MKQYIVIDTWNGEGYSTENGTQIKIFDSINNFHNNKIFAEQYAELEATRQLPYPVSERFKDEGVTTFITSDTTIFGWTIGGEGYEDHGTYQVHELPEDAYAVMIRTNVNEVDILNALEYADWIEELSSDFEADYDPSEKEDYFHYEDNGDLFVECFGSQDFDYQFRLIKNIK